MTNDNPKMNAKAPIFEEMDTEPTPQPKRGAGEKHDQTLWRCECGFLAIRIGSMGAPGYCCGCKTHGNFSDITQCPRCAELENALREGLHLNSLRSDMKLQDQLDEFKRIANAALAGKGPK